MMKIKYSIVVPHKNSFDLLLKLLKSIPEQSDFEVIIVDDNSNYSEKEKINSHSFNDNVIVIFNSDSGGAGKARNLALERASGKWVIFADADDYFSENMEILLDDYFEAKEDIIYFGTSSVFADTNQIASRHVRYMNLVSDYLKNINDEDALRYYFTPPWGKMIRRELIESNNIRFEEILASNDIYFSLKSAFHAKSITATLEILYIITVSHGSLTNSFSKSHFDARFNAALRANKFLCIINKKKYQQSVLYFLAKSYKLGMKYVLYVLLELIKHRSNLFIGLDKVLKYKKVLNERENAKYLIKKVG
ncbi:glycosyltransferase family 2 protein [Flavobacterium sp. 83]|uniref:glycosyltransferase family 2 protein n=1 Tax=Flavobacterium sp. 83 TaxID=1131812 RepID=UPI00068F74B5|nr:glycosyltransferase family 2 protein [Flavobacterium sp. 83]